MKRHPVPVELPSSPSHRWRYWIACLALVTIGAAGCRGRESRAPARDIVLITIDTLRADAVGYSGNARIKTPFLDSIAARGVEFTNAHAHNVITLPSHTNIITGLYPFQHGVRENAGFKLDPSHKTIGTMLKAAGYATGAFVGAYPLDSRYGLNQGFDVYDDNYGKGQVTVDFVVQERRAEVTLAAATQWWRANEGKKRFLWVHCYDPHAPYRPPEPFLTQYKDNRYYGEIAYVDDALSKAIGPILAADPDALIVITADHGEALGDHGEETHGLFAYESTLKIPLLVAGHGIGHRVVTDYVRHIDIVPTILQIAGVAKPAELPGSSLLDERLGARDTYFESLSAMLNRGWAPLTGIIHGDLKYIDLPESELYDLPRDPHETHNLREGRRRDVLELSRLLAPMVRAPERGRIAPEEVARLRSLGYVSGSAPQHAYTAADDPKNLIGLDKKMHDSIDAFESGHPAEGLRIARELVAERPQMNAGRSLLAFMLEQNDMVPEAIEQLRILTARPDASTDDRVQLALLLSETGHPEQAVTLLASHAGEDDPDLLNAYGVALSDSGHHDLAVEQFQHVLALDPNDAPALQNLGIESLKRGDAQTAETDLTRALTLNAHLPLALNALGVLYAQRNDAEGAIDAWKRAVQSDRRQYDALLNIGLVAARIHRFDEAKPALQRFIATAPRTQYGSDIANAQRMLAQMP